MKNTAVSSKSGFTLVEVVLAGSLSVLLFLPLTKLSTMVVLNSQYSRQSTEALAAGQLQLETLDEAGYDAISSGTSTTGIYTLTWTSTELSNSKRVRMLIEWELADSPYELSLNTVYHE